MITKEMLEESIEHFGLNDIVTIMLSHRLEKEITEKQKRALSGEWHD